MEYPMEAIYIRIFLDKAYLSRDLGCWLLSFAKDLYFTRFPWLLTVVAGVQLKDPDLKEKVLEKQQYRYCGVARIQGDQIMLFEADRKRWVMNHQFKDLPEERMCAEEITRSLGKRIGGAPINFFSTGSSEKWCQYQYLFRSLGIELHQVRHSVSLIEPQVEGFGEDPESILVFEPLKLFSRFAAKEQSYPFVVEDTMLFIEHFNDDFDKRPILPGPDTKRWWAALGIDGILKTMEGSTRRRAIYVCQLGLHIGPGQYERFRAEVTGRLAVVPKMLAVVERLFPYSNGKYFHSLFIPDGSDKTLGEMQPAEFRRYDYRRHCLTEAAPMLIKYGASWSYVQEEIPF